MSIITLTTDFGTVDGYAGAMKGVILSLAPHATIVDLSHDVPPHDVAAAAFCLANAARTFPAGTIHVVVVDPGVGGARRGVAVRGIVDPDRARIEQLFVAPDNGVLSLAVRVDLEVRELRSPSWRREPVSATFHGRDVFAVAAARLANGARPSEAGPEVGLEGRLAARPIERVYVDAEQMVLGRMTGSILHVDRFGNAITDLPANVLDFHGVKEVTVGALRFDRLRRTYEEVARGEPLAYLGSFGTLEIAVREGSASERYGLRRGDPVTVVIR
jgi:hypothetical protein